MKPALLILDPQNDFFASENPNLPAFRRSIPVINAAIACFREKGWPVVFVQMDHGTDSARWENSR